MTNRNFTCPYCSKPTTVTEPNQYSEWSRIRISKPDVGDVGLFTEAVTCPNTECNKLWLSVKLCKARYSSGGWSKSTLLQQWLLLPESEAIVLPDYVPEPIKEDYYEACRIKHLSPKASATLARRCLQGMIRDFHGITDTNLKKEIDALEEIIDVDTWQAVHAIREVGNIGAHMEKDINVIVDVEPEEAQLLIGLIEQLVQDWYVQRYNRKQRTAKVREMAGLKKAHKENSSNEN